ncbi:hypothetical protein HN587_02040 [Candidatus Woesearchaeota archaeon]|jgi:molybdopterin/thiamine biosynthesis adenylyltransferase|nr:hypothetical protein [Candidatus Woesearchaeota archaeon]
MAGNRAARQTQIENWKQELIDNNTLTVIGGDTLAQYVLVGAAGLGVGELFVVDNSRVDKKVKGQFLHLDAKEGRSGARALEEIVSAINTDIDVFGVHTQLVHEQSGAYLPKRGVLLDATNDPRSKKVALEYAVEHGMKLILTSTNHARGEILVFNPETDDPLDPKYLQLDFKGQNQGAITSGVMGGIACEIYRKLCFQLDEKDVVPARVDYAFIKDEKLADLDDASRIKALKSKKVLEAGLGALGVYITLGLALENVGAIHGVDYDDVEETNLNRQWFYYDSVGDFKGDGFLKVVGKINPEVVLKYIFGKIGHELSPEDRKAGMTLVDPEYIAKRAYDVIAGGVDSERVRSVLNEFAIVTSIPYVDGGTSFKNGQAVAYVPQKTQCLECAIKIDEKADEHDQRAGCLLAHESSVVMSNMVIGSMVAGKILKILAPEFYGDVEGGLEIYDARSETVMYALASDVACNCHETRELRYEPDASKKGGQKWYQKKIKLFS